MAEKIQGLVDVPADKLADALAVTVPGLAAEVIEDLSATAASLDRLAAERTATEQPLSWQFDPTLVRGMGYYTGQVFEIIHQDMNGSVAGGGRYDKLIGRSLGYDVPACGFSIGFERIVDLLSRGLARDAVAVLVESDVPVADALAVAREMRAARRAFRGGAGGRDGAAQREVRRPAQAAGGGGVQRVRTRSVRGWGDGAGRAAGARRRAARVRLRRHLVRTRDYRNSCTSHLHSCLQNFLHVPMHLHLLC